MAFAQPKKWNSWLSTAELWYNTRFHTALKMTPFQALYSFPPPQVAEMFLVEDMDEDPQAMLETRQLANQVIRDNLLQAQERMKHDADKNISESTLELGDMAYLHVQPYRHTSLSLHQCVKLHSKFYGPFCVIAKVGETSYKLLLPEGCKLHPIFHISQLKKHHGPMAVPEPTLPLIDEQHNIQIGPKAVLKHKLTPRKQGDIFVLVIQWLMEWINLPMEAATWEDADFILKVFPDFQP